MYKCVDVKQSQDSPIGGEDLVVIRDKMVPSLTVVNTMPDS